MMTRAKFWDVTVLNAICSGVLLMLGGCGESSAEGRSEPLAKAAIAGELFSLRQPHWLSCNGAPGKGLYVKSKDKLGDLLEMASKASR